MVRHVPASPVSRPQIHTAEYRTPFTLTPTVSTAFGFSPTARIFNPKLVLYRMMEDTGTRINAA